MINSLDIDELNPFGALPDKETAKRFQRNCKEDKSQPRMKLKFKTQACQIAAVQAMVDCFAGQPAQQ